MATGTRDITRLPNPAVVNAIHGRYYVDRDGRDAPYVSSHWADRSSKFDVEIGADGTIRRFNSIGMGLTASTHPLDIALAHVGWISHLARLPQRARIARLLPMAFRVVRKMGMHFSFNCFKDVCALELILRHLDPEARKRRLNVLMIGDGYGFFSSLIKTALPNARLVLVDIGKTLLFQSVNCQVVHPQAVHRGINEAWRGPEVDFVYCPTEDLEQIDIRFDLVTNVGSMQEMNPETVDRYFDFIRRHAGGRTLFYCCNREHKRLRGGEVSAMPRYAWSDRDRHLVDERCPWYGYQLMTYVSPRFGGVRLPRIKRYQPILHRLTEMAPAPAAGTTAARTADRVRA